MVPASLDTTYKNKSRHRIYICHENELKMAHRIIHRTIKLLENKRWERILANLQDDFLNSKPKVQVHEIDIDKSGFIKMQHSCPGKGGVWKIRRQATGEEKTFATDDVVKDSYPKYMKIQQDLVAHSEPTQYVDKWLEHKLSSSHRWFRNIQASATRSTSHRERQ